MSKKQNTGASKSTGKPSQETNFSKASSINESLQPMNITVSMPTVKPTKPATQADTNNNSSSDK